MSDEETDIEALNEGEEDAVISDEDKDQEEVEEDFTELVWTDEPTTSKKKEKDVLKGEYKKLLFSPSTFLIVSINSCHLIWKTF